MSSAHYVTYHNSRKLGRYDPDDVGAEHCFFTRKPHRKEDIEGSRLWVIESHGDVPRYLVVGTSLIEKFTMFCDGEATVRARCDVKLPPTDVTDEPWFVALLEEQRRFARGLNRIRAEEAASALDRLRTDATKKTRKAPKQRRAAPVEPAKGQDGASPVRAFSVRQPWAELILQGTKTTEFRSLRTNIRERVYVYAGEGRYPKDEEAALAEEYGLNLDELDRGFLVGTVEIVDCREASDGLGFEWLLARPQRAKRLLRPKNHPQPRFFRPF